MVSELFRPVVSRSGPNSALWIASGEQIPMGAVITKVVSNSLRPGKVGRLRLNHSLTHSLTQSIFRTLADAPQCWSAISSLSSGLQRGLALADPGQKNTPILATEVWDMVGRRVLSSI